MKWIKYKGRVMLISVLTTCATLFALYFYTHYYPEDFHCKSDIVFWRTNATGDVTELRLTTFFLLQNNELLTVVHKGVMKQHNQALVINRDYKLKVKKDERSRLFSIESIRVNKMPDDTAEDNIVDEMVRGSANYFYISNLNDRGWMIQGLVLPMMACVRM